MILNAKRNKANGVYFKGRATDIQTKARAVDMYRDGRTFTDISNTTGLMSRGARKICEHFVNKFSSLSDIVFVAGPGDSLHCFSDRDFFAFDAVSVFPDTSFVFTCTEILLL